MILLFLFPSNRSNLRASSTAHLTAAFQRCLSAKIRAIKFGLLAVSRVVFLFMFIYKRFYLSSSHVWVHSSNFSLHQKWYKSKSRKRSRKFAGFGCKRRVLPCCFERPKRRRRQRLWRKRVWVLLLDSVAGTLIVCCPLQLDSSASSVSLSYSISFSLSLFLPTKQHCSGQFGSLAAGLRFLRLRRRESFRRHPSKDDDDDDN